jgi:diguanylate cyclase (GGDEF)-like protein
MEASTRKIPWLVLAHHRMRTLSFAMVFGATCLQIAGKNYSLMAWALLVLLLLVYPHLQFWRATHSDNPVQTELRNLFIDSLLLGMYIAGIGFSQWLAYSVMLATTINNVVNKGWRGLVETMVALLGGIIICGVFTHFTFTPETNWPATVSCIFGLTLYLILVARLGHKRNTQLRRMREQLQQQEKDLLAANISMQQQLQWIEGLQEQLLEQTNRDPLTGLHNRRYLDSTLLRELARCQREGNPLSLILIDIDHFKAINDEFGHQAGDEMLIRLGGVFRDLARASDVVCRYGGEEFLLLAPTMPPEIAIDRAEALRIAIRDMTIPFHGRQLHATISIGVAAYPHHATTAAELIMCADEALYCAKRSGRNRVQVADGPLRVSNEHTSTPGSVT